MDHQGREATKEKGPRGNFLFLFPLCATRSAPITTARPVTRDRIQIRVLQRIRRAFRVGLLKSSANATARYVMNIAILLSVHQGRRRELTRVRHLTSQLRTNDNNVNLTTYRMTRRLSIVRLVRARNIIRATRLNFILLIPRRIRKCFQVNAIPIRSVLTGAKICRMSIRVVPFHAFTQRRLPPRR